MTAHSPQLPRLFRRRLFVMMLAAGLLPVMVWGILGHTATERFLSVSLEPLVSRLGRLDTALAERGADAALRDDLRQAQLNLAQAELTRQSLRRLAPWAFGLLVAVSSVLLAVAASRLGRALSTPVERLTQAMLRQAGGEHGYRIPESGARRPDELQFLIQRFNAMSQELDAQRRRLQMTEKLVAWQEVARVLAHDLKNPLTAMRMAMARLARSSSPELQEPLSLLQEEIEVLIRMTQSFSTLAALPEPELRPLELKVVVEEVCALYREQAPVSIEAVAGPAVSLQGDADQLRRVFGNLVKNAVEASESGDGAIRVRLEPTSANEVRIEIDDSGAGIAAPLDGAAMVTGRRSMKPGGSGLGLPICQKIVHDHGGSLRLEPLPSKGTRAIVVLPLRGPAAVESGGAS